MRFNGIDWLWLLLTCIVTSAAMAGMSWAVWAAIGFRRSLQVHTEVALALSLLAAPLNALAAWPVLRRCVNGLQLTPWLREIALGAALGGFISLPALTYAVLMSEVGLGKMSANSPNGPVGWLPVAAYIMALCPPGLLLQRLGGANTWMPIIVVAMAMALIPLIWSGQAIHLYIPFAMLFLTQVFLAGLTIGIGMTAFAVAISGMLTGLTLGAGLFLMARRSRSAITR